MRRPVYLDYMATTPVDRRVVKKMLAYLDIDGNFGNPASNQHIYGWKAQEAISIAKEQVASVIQGDPKGIIWTSGATEAINLALKGAAHFYQRQGKHILTTQVEHKAVLDTCRALEDEGFEVTYLAVEKNGLLNLETLKKAVRHDTILCSLIHVNNELGVIHDLKPFGVFLKSKGILFHVDAAQSPGKTPIDIQDMQIDLLSLSGHKVYAPKGIGALYVRQSPRLHLTPLLHGGGQQNRLRSGTLPTHQIVAMGEAFRIAKAEMASENQRLLTLRNQLWESIKDLPNLRLNGDLTQRVANNLHITFLNTSGDVLLEKLKDLAISSSSACSTSTFEPSHVLKALGFSDKEALSSFRFSLGRFTTEEEIDFAVKAIQSI